MILDVQSTDTKTEEELAQVKAGMELLRWQYDRSEIPLLLKSGRFGCYSQVIGLPVQSLTGSVFGLFMVPIGMIAGGPIAGAASAIGVALGTWLLGKFLARAGPPHAPQVIFTSTGVILGEHGWLWRGSRVGRFSSVRFEGEEPVRLVLGFRGGGRTTEFVLPCPSGLEYDVSELAELLRIRTTKVRAKQVEPPPP